MQLKTVDDRLKRGLAHGCFLCLGCSLPSALLGVGLEFRLYMRMQEVSLVAVKGCEVTVHGTGTLVLLRKYENIGSCTNFPIHGFDT